MSELFNGYGVEVKLLKTFHVVRETLTRIGIQDVKNKNLIQTCHILHKRDHYSLIHFKEMFLFDGKEADFSETDRARRDYIIMLLVKWGYVELVDQVNLPEITPNVAILSKQDVADGWNLVKKYTFGGVKKED